MKEIAGFIGEPGECFTAAVLRDVASGRRAEQGNRFLRSDRRFARWVEVEGVIDKRGVDKRVKREPPGAARARIFVVCQAPAGVKRHAVAEDGLAAQQRLKTGKRRQRMHFVYLFEHIDDIRLRGETIRPAQRVSRAGFALAVAAGHVRVRLEDDIRLGISGAHHAQERGNRADALRATDKRGIVADLPWHQQNTPSPCRCRQSPRAARVVFTDPAFDNLSTQCCGARRVKRSRLRGVERKGFTTLRFQSVSPGTHNVPRSAR